MDLKELDYIVTVANEGSISRAAEKLFMAQSSLSQAVRKSYWNPIDKIFSFYFTHFFFIIRSSSDYVTY